MCLVKGSKLCKKMGKCWFPAFLARLFLNKMPRNGHDPGVDDHGVGVSVGIGVNVGVGVSVSVGVGVSVDTGVSVGVGVGISVGVGRLIAFADELLSMTQMMKCV